MTTRVTVTGAAGKIGSRIVPRLRESGFEVTQLVRVTDPGDSADPSIRPVDLTDAAGLERELTRARTEVLLHLAAALPSANVAREDRGMAEALAQAARQTGVSRIVFASSASVYGDRVDVALDESREPDPRTPYALAKLAAEEVFTSGAVETLILRIFNVFGHGLEHSLVAKLCEATAEHPFEPIAVDSFVRDYVHLDDVTRAFVASVGVNLPHGHQVVNVGSGQRLSTRELIGALERFRPIHAVPRPGPSSWSWADPSRMRDVLGFAADTRLERFDPAGFMTSGPSSR
jgi:nucleoside-diphosphate-sugar epimerase